VRCFTLKVERGKGAKGLVGLRLWQEIVYRVGTLASGPHHLAQGTNPRNGGHPSDISANLPLTGTANAIILIFMEGATHKIHYD
jgi:hypothetical protein